MAYFSCGFFQRRYTFMRSLADSAGKRIGNKGRLKNEVKNLKNRVMQDPVANSGFVNMPYLRVVNIERGVRIMFVSHFRKLAMEFKKIVFQIKFKFLNVGIILFP